MSSINFYEGEYYLLSNFSAHQVEYGGELWMTSEHAYQAAKYHDPAVREKIKRAPSAFLVAPSFPPEHPVYHSTTSNSMW